MDRCVPRTAANGIIRVVLIDDQAMVREGLRLILSSQSDITVVGEGRTGSEALRLVGGAAPDVLALELLLPKRDSLDIIKTMAAQQSPTRILVVTRLASAHTAIRSLRAGAAGFVRKESDAKELLAAIRAVHRGKVYVPGDLKEQILDQCLVSGRPGASPERLSDRELQVSLLLASGISNREIADTLSISVKTVDTHRSNVLRKLGLRNNADLTRYAIQLGLLE